MEEEKKVERGGEVERKTKREGPTHISSHFLLGPARAGVRFARGRATV